MTVFHRIIALLIEKQYIDDVPIYRFISVWLLNRLFTTGLCLRSHQWLVYKNWQFYDIVDIRNCYLCRPKNFVFVQQEHPGILHTILVISPLVSLMSDQCSSWNAAGFSTAFLTTESHMTPEVKHGNYYVIIRFFQSFADNCI